MESPDFALGASERAALERLGARRDVRAARRARIVLAAADGMSLRAVARAEGVDRNTVRRWLRRFSKAREAGLADSPGRGRPRGAGGAKRVRGVGLPPPVYPPSGRLDECIRHVRDRIASGALRPGERLAPPREEAARRGFGESTVRRAYAALAEEGFLVPAGRGRRCGPLVPERTPEEGRHLLVLGGSGTGGGANGFFERALRAAAAALSAARGVAFDEARPGRDVFARDYVRLREDCLRRRWQGAFFQNFAAQETDHPASIPRLPGLAMSGCWLRPQRLDSRVVPVAGWSGLPDRIAAALVRECREAGCREIVFLAARTPQNDPEAREASLREAAAKAGLRCGPFGFQALDSAETAQTRRVFDLLASNQRAEFDAVAVLDDNLLPPLCEALLAWRGPEAARRVFVASHGNAPVLPAVPLPVVFRGVDATATLASYLDWCDALRAGERNPPGPAVAHFREPLGR